MRRETGKVLIARLWPWTGNAHGGALRSQQITELARRAIPDAAECQAPNLRASSLRFQVRVLAESARDIGTIIARRLGPRDAVFLGMISRLLREHRMSPGDVVVFDADRMNGKPLLALAAKRNMPVIATPQNFEALYPTEWPPRYDLDKMLSLMRREVDWLSRAARVWTIGTLDQELLGLFGVPAQLLPYQPPAVRRDELLGVRRQRTAASQDYALVLGSATNSPTRTGMLELLRFSRARPAKLPIVVAGFGTEQLAAEAGPGVRVLGAQSDISLRGLLTGARLLWLHQGPMTGALTRVNEALIAGVPILANRWAARSALPNPGLRAYDSLEETPELLERAPSVPTIPDISAYEEAFIADLRSLASRGAT
jgi:glycosyltransferase involved in cell wall biosynthesis